MYPYFPKSYDIEVWLQMALVAITSVYTIGTFLLFHLTKKSVQVSIEQQSILQQQQSIHLKELKSSLERDTIKRHRDLFSSIMGSPELLEVFAEETGLNEKAILRRFLATLIINHARVMYLDYSDSIGPDESYEGFVLDFQEILQFPFMKERWEQVKSFHPKEFRTFTDELIIQ